MSKTIWFISKYAVPRQGDRMGDRGFSILREMVKKGYHCVMLCSDSNHLSKTPVFDTATYSETIDCVDVTWIKTHKYQSANSIGRILSWVDFEWRLWRLPKSELACPDVVIVSSLSLLTVLNGFRLRWRYSCKLVFEVRDIWPLSLTELRQWSRWHPIVLGLGFVEWLGYRYSDLIVGTMPNLAEHVENTLGYARPVGCIPQGVDEALCARPEPLDPEFAREHIPDGKFVIVYAGSIGIANAMDVMFEAACKMKAHKEVHFLVLGEGYLKADYQARYAGLSNLSFAPAVPKKMVQSVLASCDLMYFSSQDSQLLKFGQSLNKVVDYMLSGKPTVASYSGYPSMIDESGCGSFVPSNDVDALVAEIERYAEMPEAERLAMGEAGMHWVLENRNFSKLADDYIALIDG